MSLRYSRVLQASRFFHVDFCNSLVIGQAGFTRFILLEV